MAVVAGAVAVLHVGEVARPDVIVAAAGPHAVTVAVVARPDVATAAAADLPDATAAAAVLPVVNEALVQAHGERKYPSFLFFFVFNLTFR